MNQRLCLYLSTFWYPGQFEHLSHALLCDLSAAINPALEAHAAESPLSRVVRQAIERTVKDDIARRQVEVGTATSTPGVTPPEATEERASTVPQVVVSMQSTGPSSADGASRAVSSSKDASEEDPVKVKAKEWLNVLGSQVEHDQGVQLLGDGKVEISRKSLGFGASPSDNYAMLHRAGAVDKKLERSVVLNVEWSKAYIVTRASRKC